MQTIGRFSFERFSALEQDQNMTFEGRTREIAYTAIFRSSLPEQSDLDVKNPTIMDLIGKR